MGTSLLAAPMNLACTPEQVTPVALSAVDVIGLRIGRTSSRIILQITILAAVCSWETLATVTHEVTILNPSPCDRDAALPYLLEQELFDIAHLMDIVADNPRICEPSTP